MNKKILAAIIYLERNLAEHITLEEVSSRVGLSKFYFERLFQTEVGVSFYAYLKRIRLHNAACRLKWTNQSVYEIAIAHGYGSNTAFARAFRSYFGVPPTEFRAGASRELAIGQAGAGGDPPRIHVRDIGAFHCLFRRYYGPFETIRDSWRDFIERLPAELLDGHHGRTRFLGRVYDDPRITPPREIRYDCCYAFASAEDARLYMAGSDDLLITTEPGLYAVIDNLRAPRTRTEIRGHVLEQWMPRTRYHYSDLPWLELFSTSPLESNRSAAPACTMLVPLE